MKLSERIRDYAEGEERIVKWANGVAQLEDENEALKMEVADLQIDIDIPIAEEPGCECDPLDHGLDCPLREKQHERR